MTKKSVVPFTFSVGNVIFIVLKILTIVSTVVLLLSILSLSFLPEGTIRLDSETKMSLNLDLGSFGEGWEEYRTLLKGSFAAYEELLGAKLQDTDTGLALSAATGGESIGNRAMALYFIPSFVQSLLYIFLFHFLAKLCKAEKEALLTPFVPQAREALRSLSFVLFALSVVPYLAASLLSMMTGVSIGGEASLNALLALLALLVLALSEIFRFGEKLSLPLTVQGDMEKENKMESEE